MMKNFMFTVLTVIGSRFRLFGSTSKVLIQESPDETTYLFLNTIRIVSKYTFITACEPTQRSCSQEENPLISGGGSEFNGKDKRKFLGKNYLSRDPSRSGSD